MEAGTAIFQRETESSQSIQGGRRSLRLTAGGNMGWGKQNFCEKTQGQAACTLQRWEPLHCPGSLQWLPETLYIPVWESLFWSSRLLLLSP